MHYRARLIVTSLSVFLATGLGGVAAEPNVSDGAPAPDSSPYVSPPCNDWSYGCPDALWTVSVDGLFLNRSKPGSQPLLVNNVATTVFDANQFDFPTQLGWEVDVQRRICRDWSLEGRYFDLGIQSATATNLSFFGAGVPYNTPLAATGVFGFGPVISGLTYSSQLQNVEFNARKDLTDNIQLLAGVRFLALYEDGLEIDQIAKSGPSIAGATQKLSAFNNLVGCQVGADGTFFRCGRFSLEGSAKCGLYGDAARNRFSYVYASLVPAALVNVNSGTSGGGAAFAGEFGVRGTCQVIGGWSVFAGYDLLLIDGVALASQQASANTSPALGPATTVQMSGSVFYQGATAGVEFRY